MGQSSTNEKSEERKDSRADDNLDENFTARMAQEELGSNSRLLSSIKSLRGESKINWDEDAIDMGGGFRYVDTSAEPETRQEQYDPESPVPEKSEESSVLSEHVQGEIENDPELQTESVRLSKLSSDLTNYELEKKVLDQGQLISNLMRKNSQLVTLLTSQGNILTRLEKTIAAQGKQIVDLSKTQNDLSNTLDEKVVALSDDFKKRLQSTLEIHRETPELVERLVSATQKVLEQIPEEFKTQIKEVKIDKKDSSRLQDIVQATTSHSSPKKNIPKKLRR